VQHISKGEKEGAILIFMPGLMEITTLHEELLGAGLGDTQKCVL
jgi:HrpA-like RNA helicase